jgi:hypothetical protein
MQKRGKILLYASPRLTSHKLALIKNFTFPTIPFLFHSLLSLSCFKPLSFLLQKSFAMQQTFANSGAVFVKNTAHGKSEALREIGS